MTLDEQLAVFDRKAEQLYGRSLRRLKDPDYKRRVIARARQRWIDGHRLYGDSILERTHAELCDEELEEHADGMIDYPFGRWLRGWPT